MKRILTISIVLLLITSFNIELFANGSTQKSAQAGKASFLGELNIKYKHNKDSDLVAIPLSKNTTYNIQKTISPNRLIIKLENAKPVKKNRIFNIYGNSVRAIEYSETKGNTTTIYVNLKGELEYKAERAGSEVSILIQRTNYKGITYTRNGDRVVFNLERIKLTDREEDIKNLYEKKYGSAKKVFTLSFSNDLGDLGSGTMFINDELFNYVKIIKDTSSSTTHIVFSAKTELLYHVIARYDSKNNCIGTAITILKPLSKGEKLVVIDPGHGGYETGAYPSHDFIEKDLNLDIAKRVNTLLKSKNIKTYMIREEDTYIDLYERAYIANMLNATLFVSIHNNANNMESRGTETLYFPDSPKAGGVDSKQLAQNIQNGLISSIGTIDRGLVPRPGLCVLRKTLMPAVITEVAFMDNKYDRTILMDEDFKQKSAIGICNGILKTLDEVKLP